MMMFWKNLNVRWKLAFAMAPLVAIITFSSLNSNHCIEEIVEYNDDGDMYASLGSRLLQRSIDHLLWAQKLTIHLALDKPGLTDLQTDPTQCRFGKWYTSQERLETEKTIPALKPILAAIAEPHAALHKSALSINAALEKHDTTLARKIMETETAPALTAVLKQLTQGAELLKTEIAAVQQISKQKQKELYRFNLIALVASILVALICVLALLEAILTPLGKLQAYAKACTQGEKATLVLHRRDAFGELGDAMVALMQKLGAQMAFSQAVLTGLPIATALFDRNNVLTYTNKRMIDLLEHTGSPENYYGQTSGTFMFGEAGKRTAAFQALETLTLQAMATEMTTMKGHSKFILAQAAPLLDENGQLTGALSIWVDTTDMHNKEVQISAARESMLRVATSAQSVAEIVASASDELSATIEQAARGAEMQSEQVTATSAAMLQMNTSISGIHHSADNVANVAAQAADKAREGSTLVQDVISAMHDLANKATLVQQSMGDLEHQADGVGRVISVISDIADQTNLLALNAAIEAARAGDAGRGFAVVADEVRKLAEKTMNATSEVIEVIQNIQKGARSNAQSVVDVVHGIDSTVTLTGASGEALTQIVNLVDSVALDINGIVAASDQQATSCEEITSAMRSVANVADESSCAAVQAAESTASLAEQAGKLQELINSLK